MWSRCSFTGDGLESLAAASPEELVSSRVGCRESTLVNALVVGAVASVVAVRAPSSRPPHDDVSRVSLLPCGGWLIDTPGCEVVSGPTISGRRTFPEIEHSRRVQVPRLPHGPSPLCRPRLCRRRPPERGGYSRGRRFARGNLGAAGADDSPAGVRAQFGAR